MVGLKHDHVAPAQLLRYVGGQVAQIRCQPDADPLTLEHEADRVGRIVRDGERRDVEIADGEPLACLEIFDPGQCAWVCFRPHRFGLPGWERVSGATEIG